MARFSPCSPSLSNCSFWVPFPGSFAIQVLPGSLLFLPICTLSPTTDPHQASVYNTMYRPMIPSCLSTVAGPAHRPTPPSRSSVPHPISPFLQATLKPSHFPKNSWGLQSPTDLSLFRPSKTLNQSAVQDLLLHYTHSLIGP